VDHILRVPSPGARAAREFPSVCSAQGSLRPFLDSSSARRRARDGYVSEVICKICALFLIRRCYERHWWFRLVREPLVLWMRALAWWNGIDVRKHVVRRPECRNCVRFMKAELEEKSAMFRFLDTLIGPHFKKLRDSMLQPEEFQEAKRIAADAAKEPVTGEVKP